MAQRQSYRFSKLYRYAATALALSLLPDAAMAEVCDKVAGEDWRPAAGGLWASAIPVAIELTAILGLVVAVHLARISVLAYVIAILLPLRALFVVAWMAEDDIYSIAVREGCKSLSVDLIHIAILVVLAIACVWLGLRLRGRHAEAT